LVTLAHGALLWWLTTTLGAHPEPVTLPVMIGQLVAPTPVTAPQPLPVQPTPPRPRPVVRPRPAPVPPAPPAPLVPPLPTLTPLPAPAAPPSERAVTAPPAAPAEAAAPAATAAPASAFPSAPASAAAATTPAAPAVAEPVIGPRSDAAHLSNPAPAYPAISRRLGEQGRVLLDVYILPDGSVGELRLRRSSGFARLDDAALRAVRHWRYVPARRGDEPIAYWYVQPLDFSLQ
jgi:protein TonB